MKTAENKGFLTFLNAMGRSVPLKTPIRFQIANKINGFVHVSYGTALCLFRSRLRQIDAIWAKVVKIVITPFGKRFKLVYSILLV